MPGAVIKKKATKTHSGHREHKTPKRIPQSSHQVHETPKRIPQSSRQGHKPTKPRTHSGYRAHKFEKENCRKPYWCDGCKESGYRSRYKRDNVELHRECLFPSPTTSHDFFPGYTFKFLKKTPGEEERFCDACGMGVKGFVYHCEAKGWDLHPFCSNLKNEKEIDGVKFQLCNKVPKKRCIFCKKKELPNGVRGIPGWSYVSKTENDNCHFHVNCSMKWVIDSWKDIEQQDNNRLTLKNLSLTELKADSIKRDGKVSKYLRIAMLVLRCTASLLFGDPTQLLFYLPDFLSSLR
ncbi:uncharacterized protein LOC126697497 [Quercus robur]|uniref:uncharacterized protein LOC126697497 n=1 Tax=Quercus robur TaxID=38942 RepID=UPI00216171E1|nr:uncharacterized protein LOC126697497 [Quercus robur]